MTIDKLDPGCNVCIVSRLPQRVLMALTAPANMETAKVVQSLLIALTSTATAGCYVLSPSSGGGQTGFSPPRNVMPADIALPEGFRIEVVATGLTFPTGVAFDAAGNPHVVESGYSYGEAFTVPRLLGIDADGTKREIARGDRNGPWTGLAHADGNFYVAEGGQLEGGRILRISSDGKIARLLENLPSQGDHHTNGPAVGPDRKVYFAQGTATNSGVVGNDNAKYGWLKRFPRFHDTPCRDISLAGENFETSDALNPESGERVSTGAYSPFGTATRTGQVIKGRLPCNGAVMRMNTDGSGLELVASGFRNPFGLAFAPDGQLYLTENGFDDRGSRPVWGAGDVLWRVTEGAWYGWPDFAAGRLLSEEQFTPPGKRSPPLLLQNHPGAPPRPIAVLGVHASANGLDFSRSPKFGYVGEAFVAEFGDLSPGTGKSMHPVGFRVVRVDVKTGRIETFAANKGDENGPASKIGGHGFERPIAVRFNPSGDALYVVDFGVMITGPKGPEPKQGTGVLWRIVR